MKATGTAKVKEDTKWIYAGHTFPIIEHYRTDGDGTRYFRLSLKDTKFSFWNGAERNTTVIPETDLEITDLEIESSKAEQIAKLNKENQKLRESLSTLSMRLEYLLQTDRVNVNKSETIRDFEIAKQLLTDKKQ